MKSSEIGGQAVIEGIMMRNGDEYAVAVRKPDGEIHVKTEHYEGISGKCGILSKIPFIRGIFKFADSMVLGIRTLMYSAEFFEEDEEEQKKELTAKEQEKKEKQDAWAMRGMLAFSLVFAVVIFMMVPYFLSSLFKNVIPSYEIRTLLEGVVRILIFILYLALISRMEDIQRTFMYHGAEHKCINCVENGKPLTVENVLESSRFHRRCGTSFLFLVMIVSIFLHFIFVLVPSYWFRLFGRLLMVPVVSGISFEIIQWAGRTDSKFALMMSKPGMAMQKFTTKEPTADMAEVAIKAVEAVFDWRAYLKTEFNLDIPYENKENGDLSAASAQSESGESEERTGNVPETGAAQ